MDPRRGRSPVRRLCGLRYGRAARRGPRGSRRGATRGCALLRGLRWFGGVRGPSRCRARDLLPDRLPGPAVRHARVVRPRPRSPSRAVADVLRELPSSRVPGPDRRCRADRGGDRVGDAAGPRLRAAVHGLRRAGGGPHARVPATCPPRERWPEGWRRWATVAHESKPRTANEGRERGSARLFAPASARNRDRWQKSTGTWRRPRDGRGRAAQRATRVKPRGAAAWPLPDMHPETGIHAMQGWSPEIRDGISRPRLTGAAPVTSGHADADV